MVPSPRWEFALLHFECLATVPSAMRLIFKPALMFSPRSLAAVWNWNSPSSEHLSRRFHVSVCCGEHGNYYHRRFSLYASLRTFWYDFISYVLFLFLFPFLFCNAFFFFFLVFLLPFILFTQHSHPFEFFLRHFIFYVWFCFRLRLTFYSLAVLSSLSLSFLLFSILTLSSLLILCFIFFFSPFSFFTPFFVPKICFLGMMLYRHRIVTMRLSEQQNSTLSKKAIYCLIDSARMISR